MAGMNLSRILSRIGTPLLAGLLFGLSASAGESESVESVVNKVLLSEEGSGRATAYLESPKIVTFEGRTHATWLDTPPEGFRIRARTLEHATGEWTEAVTIGEANNNHGGPALTIDEDGFLHVLYYSHHHPFRYRKSVRPNDASEWTEYEEFGTDLTYPALVCAKDGTLILVARRSYKDRLWELEMWRKLPDSAWERVGPVLRSRFKEYAQFAASLAWGPDHETLHLGTRIYEMPEGSMETALTTVGYLASPDGGTTWTRSDGTPVALPVTADTIDVIATTRAHESRTLNAGSIGVSPEGIPSVPYGMRLQESAQAYLATPVENGWHHQHLNPFLPSAFREWDLFMHGGLSYGASGQPLLVGTIMQLSLDRHEWGEVTTEVVRFDSDDGGTTWTADILDPPNPELPRWMPNIERPTGFNEMPAYPGFIYTEGVRGDTLDDKLSNRVWFVR
jgi:hypothetical protein